MANERSTGFQSDEGRERAAAEIEHLRSLETHPGYAILCRELREEIVALYDSLAKIDPEKETGRTRILRTQGRLAAIQRMLPQRGDVHERDDLIGTLISQAIKASQQT